MLTLEDLPKLKIFADNSNIKVNFSKITKELGKYRRTVKKILLWFQKKTKTRNKPSKCDKFYDTIIDLLENRHESFYYISNLWNYLNDNYNMNISYSTFRTYILKRKELYSYFKNTKKV